jgi:hypothetical protein
VPNFQSPGTKLTWLLRDCHVSVNISSDLFREVRTHMREHNTSENDNLALVVSSSIHIRIYDKDLWRT